MEAPITEDKGQGKAHHTISEMEERIKELEHQLDELTVEKNQRHHRYSHRDVNHGQKSIMEGLTLYNLIWVFIVASFLGVVHETLLQYFTLGRWIRSSGMLYGPFNQIYGLGALVLVLALYRFRHRNNFVIFFAGMVIGMTFEFLCSWVQELVFGSTSWDYSYMPGNIDGRTSILFGVGWGLMGLLFITHFWPWMSEMIARVPNHIGKPVTLVVTVLLAMNMALSAAAVARHNQRNVGQPSNDVFSAWLDKTYPDAVIAEKYPVMVFKNTSTNTAKAGHLAKGNSPAPEEDIKED